MIGERAFEITGCFFEFGDLGCLLNIEGRLRRNGDHSTRVLHVAEVLSGLDSEE